MTETLLKRILFRAFPTQKWIETVATNVWENVGYKFYIPESYLLSNEYKLIFFDFKKFGFDYVDGNIDCCGVTLNFKKEGYTKMTVNVSFDHKKRELFNYCMLIPVYQKHHYFSVNGIRQVAHVIRKDADFKRYMNKINKKFDIK